MKLFRSITVEFKVLRNINIIYYQGFPRKLAELGGRLDERPTGGKACFFCVTWA